MGEYAFFFTNTYAGGTHLISRFFHLNNNGIYRTSNGISNAFSCAIVKNSLSNREKELNDGDRGDDYEGNDKKIYKTYKIGNQLWIFNVAETKFRDESDIPLGTVDNWETIAVSDNGARIAYNENENFV